MRAWLRWLLVVLLVTSVPLQSLAAAGWSACAQRHGQLPKDAAPGAASHHHADHHGDHHVVDHAHDHHAGPGSADAAGVDDPMPGADNTCSACAPCCAAAAPAPDRPVAVASARPPAPMALPASADVGFVADVPHRPPR